MKKANANWKFLLAAARNPRQVSTIFQTTPFTAHRLLQGLKATSNPFVVELGVGAGAVTFFLKKRLRNGGRYLGLELNETLAQFAHQRFPDLKIINDSAENLATYVKANQVDVVVSTLPWTLLPNKTSEKILKQVKRALKPGGEFTAYMVAPNVWSERGSHTRDVLEENFSSVTEEWSLLNVPPAKVFRARK